MKYTFSRRLGALLLTFALSLTLVVPAWADATDVTGVTISGKDTAKVGESVELTANITGTYTNVTWALDGSNYSSDVVVTQDPSNSLKATVKADTVGSITVKVTVTGDSGNQVGNTHTVEFIPNVTLTPTSLSLQTNETRQLTPTLQPSGNYFSVTWASGDTSVATVNDRGLVTAVGKGEATITMTAKYGNTGNDEVTLTCTVTVTERPVGSVTISGYDDEKNPLILGGVGQSGQLTASIQPLGADPTVEWSSSDTSIATVDANGLVTAKGVGRAIITVTAGTGANAPHDTCAVEVSGVVLSTTTLSLYLGGESYTPSYNAFGSAAGRGNDTVQRYWQSSDALVAAVNRTTGTITPAAWGRRMLPSPTWSTASRTLSPLSMSP